MNKVFKKLKIILMIRLHKIFIIRLTVKGHTYMHRKFLEEYTRNH